ncbi:MAG: stage V sporulation protein AD [Clostridia bacterium]|nr:stage V sporulation protein AD [Clostridia bacterium]
MNGGKQTIVFDKKAVIMSGYGIAGPKEKEGNLADFFDYIIEDDTFGEKSYERAECKMHLRAIESAIERAKLREEQIDVLLCGDLLNQIISSSFTARELDIPFLGLYNACSTFGEALALGAISISGGFMTKVSCSTSSHFSTAERQYRYPLELGTQMTPTAQWTVTGSGCSILSDTGEGPKISSVTIGKVIDYGEIDANNMGAAMAPAAASTIIAHLRDLGRMPDYYDMILTGDLGIFGSELVNKLTASEGIFIADRHEDCGKMIFKTEQTVRMGGSGAGCSSLVFNTYVLQKLRSGEIKKLLFVPTGALLSRESSLQGESIPSIAHAISIEV